MTTIFIGDDAIEKDITRSQSAKVQHSENLTKLRMRFWTLELERRKLVDWKNRLTWSREQQSANNLNALHKISKKKNFVIKEKEPEILTIRRFNHFSMKDSSVCATLVSIQIFFFIYVEHIQ